MIGLDPCGRLEEMGLNSARWEEGPRAWGAVTWPPSSATQGNTDPPFLRSAPAYGKWTPGGSGPQGAVGPLLQTKGQSCFPATAWLLSEVASLSHSCFYSARAKDVGLNFANSFPHQLLQGWAPSVCWPSNSYTKAETRVLALGSVLLLLEFL